MPVRLLTSSVLKWPDAATVDRQVRHWADRMVKSRSDVWRIGYFGSYAAGTWGVGSDVDLVIIVESSRLPFHRRGAEWDATELPVPADVLVYTRVEWQSLTHEGIFSKSLKNTIWVYTREDNRQGN